MGILTLIRANNQNDYDDSFFFFFDYDDSCGESIFNRHGTFYFTLATN